MIFNSWVFGVFFFIVYLAYLRSEHRAQNVLLLIASYFFYGFWDFRFLALIFLSTTVDYVIAHFLVKTANPAARKGLLSLSLAVNLGCLAFFKYYDFFVESLNVALSYYGFNVSMQLLRIIVPVGISFYTFQTISYVIDVYRGQLKPCRSFLNFALFVSFFPQLVAGPIERATHLLRQIETPRILNSEKIRVGLWLILKGYFLKVFVADNLAKMVDPVFASTGASNAQIVLAIYAFAFQIYGDFAGYSNIARGLGSLMGFDIMVNFRSPYFAVNPSDFWSRWHISLSSWLRDYLYIPLGGNRKGQLRTAFNLMATMMLGGWWHGAEWKYFLWGLYHGFLLVLYRLFSRLGDNLRIPKLFQIIFYFHVTCLGWFIFRSNSLFQVEEFLRKLTTPLRWTLDLTHQSIALLILVLPVFFLDYIEELVSGPDRLPRWNYRFNFAICSLMFGLIYLLGSRGGIEFIYFQF